MEKFFDRLRPLIRWVTSFPVTVLVIALLVTLVALLSARRLRVDADLAQLLPPDYPSVRALDVMKESVGGETSLAVGIESPSFEANKAFADALIPKMMALRGEGRGEPFFYRYEYRRDTRFLEDNALYFATFDELERLRTYLEDRKEEAILEANPFYFSLDDEDEAPADSTREELVASYQRLVGKEYPVSEDSTVLAVHFFPTSSQTRIDWIREVYAEAERLIEGMHPEQFESGMRVTVAGRMLRRLIEVDAITGDVSRSFGIGATAVLLLVLLYFVYKSYVAHARGRFSWKLLAAEIARAPLLAVLIGVPLLMGLAWTYGFAAVTLGTLNLMTSTLGLVLFGLGIDFGIHFYARYTEERARGLGVADAAEVTFTSTGQAITVGALTTAAALFVLTVAKFRGFSEFGLMAGTGIMFALVAMLLVLPALLAVFERIGVLKLESGDEEVRRLVLSAGRFPAARSVVVASFAAVLAALILVPRVSFEYDFGALEPRYETFIERQEPIGRVVGSTAGLRNPAYVVTESPEEVPAVVEALKRHMEEDTLSPTIRAVESLQERFPMQAEEQRRKLALIRDIRSLLDDPLLEDEDADEMNMLRRAAGTDSALSLEDIPEDLRREFTSKSGEVGNFVIIYPSVGLSDGRNSIAFSRDVGRIVTADGTVYHAASSSLVGADMLRLMMAEAPWMIVVTFLIVSLLMRLNFGSIRWASMAMIPLVVGVLWMLLLMEVFDLKLNFYNLVVLPVVLGIGNDAGVHVVHRYHQEGPGSILRILRSTGEHITMASLTTMVGFGGLMTSFHPGLRSIGQVAVAGIGSTLLAAVLFLPAMLQWIEDRANTRAGSIPESDSGV